MRKRRFTIRSPESERPLAELLLTLGAAALVMCASAAGRAPPVETASARAAPPTEQPSAAAPAPEPSAAPAPSGVVPREAPLARFYAALGGIERRTRNEPVRVLWFGDSHAAADYWPNVLRQALQERFGNGGPGYIYFGLDVYRHAGVTLKHAGRWRRAPRSPSLWTRQDDGIFGLGGIRTSPADGATLTVELAAPKARAKARWELVYRLRSANASFRAGWGAESRRIDARSAAPASNGVTRISFETEPTATVTLDNAVGEPELFGAVIESTEPGVVVDTLGINGARIGTPLAWDESAWIAEVRARRPDLVVLAYGTNEVGDAVAPSRYGDQYDAFIARIRQAAPAVDCFIIGPTDRAEPDWTTHPRVIEVEAVEKQAAERLGCGFQSAVGAMGGPNSLKRWADATPALATPDRIHLTPRGYEKLGATTAEAILGGLR